MESWRPGLFVHSLKISAYVFVSTVESHLASNVHKSRLVQQDLQVAKKLQEEEDKIAKVQSKKQFGEMWVSLIHTGILIFYYVLDVSNQSYTGREIQLHTQELLDQNRKKKRGSEEQ